MDIWATRLNAAAAELSARGLLKSALFASEAAVAASTTSNIQPPQMTPETMRAKLYFDCKEYERCHQHLENTSDDIGAFLYLYSLFLWGERLKEDAQDALFRAKGTAPVNPHLGDIIQYMERTPPARESPFALYLYGVVLRASKLTERAKDALLASLKLLPYNWSAWLELFLCASTPADVQGFIEALSPHVDDWMLCFFKIHAFTELQLNEAAQTELELAGKTFPDLLFVQTKTAQLKANLQEFEEHVSLYEDILAKEPYLLDGLEAYSDNLFILGERSRMSSLAQRVTRIDKYRPESCYIVANYFSLRGEHEKAVLYNQRALTCSRAYLPAWTLLGHAYMELRNPHAAIECYRTAVDLSSTEFRAWFGLGNAYDMLEREFFAVSHFKSAIALRPQDALAWSRLGECYEKLAKHSDALHAYKQALVYLPGDSGVCYRLGLLHDLMGDTQEAAGYMRMCLQDSPDSLGAAQARLWLSRHAIDNGELEVAREYAAVLCEGRYDSTIVEDARALIRELAGRPRAVRLSER